MDKPPVHFSAQDPWREYRFILLRASQEIQPFLGHETTTSGFSPRNSPLNVAPPVPVAYRQRDSLAHPPPFHEPLALPLPSVRLLEASSLFRGVTRDIVSRSWRAKIKYKGMTWYLGTYKNESDAAQAYDSASCFISGSRAIKNFPDISYDVMGLPRDPPPWLIQRLLQQACS